MVYVIFIFKFNLYGSVLFVLSSCRWEDDIKMHRQEVGWGSIDWIVLSLDRDRWWAVVSAVMNLQFL